MSLPSPVEGIHVRFFSSGRGRVKAGTVRHFLPGFQVVLEAKGRSQRLAYRIEQPGALGEAWRSAVRVLAEHRDLSRRDTAELMARAPGPELFESLCKSINSRRATPIAPSEIVPLTRFSDRDAFPDAWLEEASKAIADELFRREREGESDADRFGAGMASLLEDFLAERSGASDSPRE